MASTSTGSSRDAGVAPRGAPSNATAGASANAAPVDTAHLDRLVEKALTAENSGRYSLAAAFYRHAADEALCLYRDTFLCTYLTLQRASSLVLQSQLEGVTTGERTTLRDEAWALASSCLPLIVGRMDANTMLPGRGTAVELAFFKRFDAAKNVIYDFPLLSPQDAQLAGLCLGYATTVEAATLFLGLLSSRHNIEAQAFVLRVVDCMPPAARSMPEITLFQEIAFASNIQQVLSGPFPIYDATFVASLRTKWTTAAMVHMRRERRLLNASETAKRVIADDTTRRRADVAEHGLKHCALPSCDKKEASVQQYKCCSACRSVWYCSEEHGALHGAEHKPVCRATTAAQQAADDADGGAA